MATLCREPSESNILVWEPRNGSRLPASAKWRHKAHGRLSKESASSLLLPTSLETRQVGVHAQVPYPEMRSHKAVGLGARIE